MIRFARFLCMVPGTASEPEERIQGGTFNGWPIWTGRVRFIKAAWQGCEKKRMFQQSILIPYVVMRFDPVLYLKKE